MTNIIPWIIVPYDVGNLRSVAFGNFPRILEMNTSEEININKINNNAEYLTFNPENILNITDNKSSSEELTLTGSES